MTSKIAVLTWSVSESLRPSLTNPELNWLWQPLLQLLAQGEPVTLERLAAVTGHTDDEIRHAMAQLPDTEYDEAGRIIGSGITLRPTPHHFTVDDHRLYTWCALDTLIFPTVLGKTAHVASPCQATATPIRLTATPDEVTTVEPATAVVSIVTPTRCTSVRTEFCDHVHFFAGPDSAHGWLAEHPEATILPVAEAFTLGHQLAQQRLLDDAQAGCC